MIELRAIVQRANEGHTETVLVVTEHRPDKYKRHHMGVDLNLNRGKIITFLGNLYGVPPGEIVWPAHIQI